MLSCHSPFLFIAHYFYSYCLEGFSHPSFLELDSHWICFPWIFRFLQDLIQPFWVVDILHAWGKFLLLTVMGFGILRGFCLWVLVLLIVCLWFGIWFAWFVYGYFVWFPTKLMKEREKKNLCSWILGSVFFV